MMYSFPINVSRDFIERHITQETLMYTYYGEPVKKGLFKSRVRADSRPTVSYYKNSNGRLIIKDFGSDYCGDWIYVVMNKYNCSYYKALHIVASDFGLIPKIDTPPVNIKNCERKLEETGDAVIQVEIKDFSGKEIKWWNSFGITEDTLNKYKVFSCKNVFLNGNIFYLNNPNKLVFGYYGGIREDIERWRVYFPGQKSYKFISNWKSFRIQGDHMLPKKGDYLIITKSMKDVMLLHEFNIPAIAPVSETVFLTDSHYKKLKERFNKLILLFDNDYTGIKFMNKVRKKYDVIPLWLPIGGPKDISDYYKAFGREKTQLLIDEAKRCIWKS